MRNVLRLIIANKKNKNAFFLLKICIFINRKNEKMEKTGEKWKKPEKNKKLNLRFLYIFITLGEMELFVSKGAQKDPSFKIDPIFYSAEMSHQHRKRLLEVMEELLRNTPKYDLTSQPRISYPCECRDCGNVFQHRKDQFGDTICLPCLKYFTTSKSRNDVKSQFQVKDVSVSIPLRCSCCNVIVHKEGPCDKCKRVDDKTINYGEDDDEYDDYYDYDDYWYGIASDACSECYTRASKGGCGCG
jgi:hypothetical protein